ncbi:nucleotidyltransferase family protein [Defluviimonas sp. WL0050]|nr:nucleotidyltransferase family protein [Defluviimonas sp. WL0050]
MFFEFFGGDVMPDLAILIPAAGASRRMRGTDKLLEVVDGQPQLRRATKMAMDTGAKVLVTLPGSGPLLPARQSALSGLRVAQILVDDWHDGMAASLRAGAVQAGLVEGLMILLPDMPGITRDDLEGMIAAFATDPSRPLRATTQGGQAAGHPVIFPRHLIQELTVLTGDRGGQIVLEGEAIRAYPLPGNRAIEDLDTPEDWAEWRQRTGR